MSASNGGGFAVSPSDTVDIVVPQALYVGTAGTLVVTMMNGQKLTIPNASGWMGIRPSRIWNTGTSAANITAFT